MSGAVSTTTDVVNRALQQIGTRTTVTTAELAAGGSNEAIQANLLLDRTRQDLLRMAPWSCAQTFQNLTLLAAAPGTPENTSPPTTLWQPGQPLPPWLYEYALPADFLRAIYVVPQYVGTQTLPIYPSGLGQAPYSNGPPVRYKLAVDKYLPVGAPVTQQVILTNQESACLAYCMDVTDPGVMDVLFKTAWEYVLAAGLVMALTGDKSLANMKIKLANDMIQDARAIDGDEQVQVNDVTPDWIRIRGYCADDQWFGGFNWGPLWPTV